MKILGAFALILSMCVPAVCQSLNDRYPTEAVKRILTSPNAFASGYNEKIVNRLGDGAAIAIIKIFTAKELVKPENVNQILSIVREAFERPEIVPVEEDRNPRVTNLLLRYLENQTTDSKLKTSIHKTEEFVENRTGEAPAAK